jgi:ElaB/YqjD/DUF883 family membrane-anchored ribosome-binding protein
MSTTSNQLGKQAKAVAEDLHEMGETVKHAAQETLGQAGEKALQCCEQGQDKVHGVACACEQFLRQKPFASVLVAAGIGVLFGRFWLRR